ncbi:MAG: RHS repeat protein [Candidatus Riflebacteria bacterium]|nr:RHS repeat protein [Candidatus Riflebacteria bacterium]
MTRRVGTAVQAIAFLCLVALARPGSGATQLDLPVPAMPPETCAEVPASTALVQVGDLRKFRLVLDRTLGKYRLLSGQCSRSGVDAAELTAGPTTGAPVPWDKATTFALRGTLDLPDGIALSTRDPLGLQGAPTGRDVVFALEWTMPDGSRWGTAMRPLEMATDASSGKRFVTVQTIGVVVKPEASDPTLVGTIEVRDLTYRVDTSPSVKATVSPSGPARGFTGATQQAQGDPPPAEPLVSCPPPQQISRQDLEYPEPGQDMFNCLWEFHTGSYTGRSGTGTSCCNGLDSTTGKPCGSCSWITSKLEWTYSYYIFWCSPVYGATTVYTKWSFKQTDTPVIVGGDCTVAPDASPETKPHPCITCPLEDWLKAAVNLVTGSLNLDPPDIETGGSTPISFARFYDANGTYDGPFGRGWTHRYNIQAVRVKNASTGKFQYIVRWWDGSRVIFPENDDSTWRNPPGWYLAASRGPSGGPLILATPDKTLYRFRPDGFIDSIQFKTYSVARVPTLSFVYDTHHRLTEVCSDTGNKVELHYNEQSKVDWIRSNTGQQVSYAYTSDGLNLLERVTDPAGFVTQYTYTGGRLLVSVDVFDSVSLSKRLLWAVYDALGRVASLQAGGTTNTYDYDPEAKQTTESKGDETGTQLKYLYDENHQFRGRAYQLPGAGSTTAAVDAQLNVASTTDQLTRTTAWSYAPSGLVTAVVAPDGARLTVQTATIAEVERPTRITLPSGSETTIEYAPGTGLPTKITDPSGAAATLDHDDAGRLVGITSPTGRSVAMEYSAGSGQLTRVASQSADRGLVSATSASYEATTQFMTSATDANGNTTTFERDERGLPTKVTDALGYSTRIAYGALRKPLEVTDARGNTVTLSWENAGRPVSWTNALRQTTSLAYTLVGDLSGVTNFRGEATRWLFDPQQRLTDLIDPLTGTTTFTRDAAGQIVSVQDPRRNTTRIQRDLRGRIIERTNPDSTTVSFGYYPDGELRTIRDELQRTTTIGIDANGRIAAVTDPAQKTRRFTYDADGRLASVSVPVSGTVTRTTSYGYNGLGRLSVLTMPDNSVYKLTYDLVGNVTDIDKTQPGGSGPPSKWHFEYDGANRLKSKTDPSQFVTYYQHDGVGNLTGLDEPDLGGARLKTTIAYDAINRPTRITRPDEVVSIAYDDGSESSPLHGMTVTLSDPGQAIPKLTITRQFDALKRLVSEQIGANKTAYTHDANSNVTGVTVNGVATLQYDYDKRDRPVKITDVRATPQRSVSLAYDGAGQLTTVTYPSGVTKNLSYGLRGEVTDILYKTAAGTPIRSLHFEHDDALQLITKDDASGGLPAQRTTYSYDIRGQLLSVSYPDSTRETFTYDTSGNIATYTSSTMSETRYHDVADQVRLVSRTVGSVPRTIQYTYDPRGNVISRTEQGVTQTYSWDSSGRLKSVTTSGVTTLAATYGDDYRFVTLQSGTDPAITPIWNVDNILTELAGPSGTEQNFTFSLLDMDTPVERGPPVGSRLTYLTDSLMTAIATIDDTGTVVSTTDYLAYGAVKRGSADPGIHGFAGARRDPNTGLVFLRNRVYDPALGRFLSRDPIGFKGEQWNLYGYVGNNPIRYRDPRGLEVWSEDFWPGGPGRRASEAEKWQAFGEVASVTLLAVPILRAAPAVFSWVLQNPVVVNLLGINLAELLGVPGLRLPGRPSACPDVGALRPVGAQLESIYDILANPWLLKGRSFQEIWAIIRTPQGWNVEGLGQGTHAGQGYVLRQYAPSTTT